MRATGRKGRTEGAGAEGRGRHIKRNRKGKEEEDYGPDRELVEAGNGAAQGIQEKCSYCLYWIVYCIAYWMVDYKYNL